MFALQALSRKLIFRRSDQQPTILYCPSLKKRLGKESLVPEGVEYIAEIVLDGISLDAVKEAIQAGIEAVLGIDGVVKVSAGNYGGKLGDYKIFLRELFP